MPLFRSRSSSVLPAFVPSAAFFRKLRRWLFFHRRANKPEVFWDPEYTAKPRYYRPPRRKFGHMNTPLPPNPPVLPQSAYSTWHPAWQDPYLYPYAWAPNVAPIGYPSQSHHNLTQPVNPYNAYGYTPAQVYRYPYHGNAGRTPYSRPHPLNALDSSSSIRPAEREYQHNYVSGRRADPATHSRPVNALGRNLTAALDSSDNNVPHMLVRELMPAASSFPYIDWNISFPPLTARTWVGPGNRARISSGMLAIHPPVRELYIFSRQPHGALALVIKRFGPIDVTSMTSLTIGNVLNEIRNYFNTPIQANEMYALDQATRDHVYQSYRIRWDSQEHNGEVWPVIAYRGPTRLDLLFGFHKFAGLQIDENFRQTRRVYLTLESANATRT
ncbi:hypothetical protein BDZ97DRAFT_1922989 [Flammula alnicola]|nr:hypothetical protein BDZ97DRAFT_1928269 [Flammula alnicola]KAF8959295.1 hypothetical protein BDZ97DRAFT_1922989 [Flammula alnicola]